MPKTYSRADWGARKPKPGPGLLYGATVKSIVLHWPATSRPIRGVQNVMAALRGWQSYHMDDKGWSDIAYQEAYDQDGNTYIGRGLDVQSGANGDEDGNEENGALLLILAPGEQPTPAMMKAARKGIARHRALFHRSRGVKGHSDVRPEPTSCPGPIVLGLIRAGEFEPSGKNVAAQRAINAARARAKDALGHLDRPRPRLRFQLERAKDALRQARKINKGKG